jgi:hypothetical protein
MTRTETTLYAIGNTLLACTVLFTCWDHGGWIFEAGVLYAGVIFGHLITEAMNEGDEA